jgi:hypothetical protein
MQSLARCGNRFVTPKEAKLEAEVFCIDPECGARVIPKEYVNRKDHYAHYSGEGKGCRGHKGLGMTEAHRHAQVVAADRIHEIQISHACEGCKKITVTSFPADCSASLEFPWRNFCLDVGIFGRSGELVGALEIKETHATTGLKAKALFEEFNERYAEVTAEEVNSVDSSWAGEGCMVLKDISLYYCPDCAVLKECATCMMTVRQCHAQLFRQDIVCSDCYQAHMRAKRKADECAQMVRHEEAKKLRLEQDATRKTQERESQRLEAPKAKVIKVKTTVEVTQPYTEADREEQKCKDLQTWLRILYASQYKKFEAFLGQETMEQLTIKGHETPIYTSVKSKTEEHVAKCTQDGCSHYSYANKFDAMYTEMERICKGFMK